MLLEENQIAFHSEDGLIFDGVKDYSRQVAEMIGLGSDSEFHQVGVSIGFPFGDLSLVIYFWFRWVLRDCLLSPKQVYNKHRKSIIYFAFFRHR